MRAARLLPALALLWTAASLAAPKVPLPEGDSERGRAIFQRHRCAACHVVAWDELSPMVGEPAMQVLLGGDEDDRLTREELATEIILPSHRVTVRDTAGRYKVDVASPMPTYARVLSIQDLADLVEYLAEAYGSALQEDRYRLPQEDE